MLLGFLFYCLGPDIEAPAQEANKDKTVNPVSLFLGLHKSKMIVIKLSLLFMLDAFAGSFVLQSIMSGWFNVKYVL
jgi:LPS O-antigen subunit length determinant protein (WzzB/FepE family)